MSFHAAKRLATVMLSFACLSTSLSATAVPAQSAPDRYRTDQVEVRLLSDASHVYLGQTITLGLQQKIIPHWHTYWKNAGDSGTSTSIAWKLPAGVTASEIIWPAPSRFVLGPITNYGYEKEVVLLTTLTIPATQAVGSQLPIKAAVNWLVCEESCIPQQATLTLTLPVSAQADASKFNDADAEQRAIIDAAKKAIPTSVNWAATYAREGDKLIARIALPATIPAALGTQSWAEIAENNDLLFYPAEWGTITHNAPQVISVLEQKNEQQLRIELVAGETPPAANSAVKGVLVVQTKAAKNTHATILFAAEFGAATAAGQPTKSDGSGSATDDSAITFWGALLFAFIGGIVLNLMPCVFPVLSIKALSLLKHSDLTSAQKRWQGVAYTLGVLASFSALAAALIAFKSVGGQAGWGFQFQSPGFVLVVAYLIFVVGLSLSGVFVLGGSVATLANAGAGLADKPGYSGSFFTGVLATVVATPCTAPFMGAALGFALTQPPALLWLIFIALGLGLSLPYLAISSWPALHAVLPKPGAWMERVKQALAFPMYAAAVWLVWVLAQQAGVNVIPLALGGMIALAIAVWVYDSTRSIKAGKRRVVDALVLIAIVSVLVLSFQGLRWLALTHNANAEAAVSEGKSERSWQAYSPAKLAELRQQGKPVFINLTAAWCITCLVNERVALSQDSFKELLQTQGITYLKGDWTNQDAEISALLKEYGRSGVPLYLFYPAGTASKAIVLPQILTPEVVRSALLTP
jgi:thiol:disulfide interchange protein